MLMFATVLNELNSPQNVGSIVRTHVAMGGGPLLMIGHDRPWRFRKGTQAFSRKLEKQCEITYLAGEEAFLEWCSDHHWNPVGVEIYPRATSLGDMVWPERPALVFGNERIGLSDRFLGACSKVARIPQFGPVGSLNVAIAHGMVTYELQRYHGVPLTATGRKYPEWRQQSNKPMKADTASRRR